MVEFPPGEPQEVCATCRASFEDFDPEFASGYANLVCRRCDEDAVNQEGEEVPDGRGGNLVYIRGQKCWRRYKFGGFVTRKDEFNCESVQDFHEKHRDDY